jgi:transcriptional regulator with XRE-family HTH domain
MNSKALNLFVKNLESVMLEKGISRLELAKKLGVSRQQISNYLGGQHFPTLDKIESIARALDAPIFMLLMTPRQRAMWEAWEEALRKAVEAQVIEEVGPKPKSEK